MNFQEDLHAEFAEDAEELESMRLFMSRKSNGSGFFAVLSTLVLIDKRSESRVRACASSRSGSGMTERAQSKQGLIPR